ncbi:MAG: DUF502 domain-containing protein [Gammaproteobacteria bacterium]
MLKFFMKTFVKGLLAFLPVFLTIYAIYYLGGWLNRISNVAAQWLVPGAPEFPGLGIAIVVAAIFVLGVLVSTRVTRWAYELVETPLTHLPVVKDLYSAFKQLTILITPSDERVVGQVVAVTHPEQPVSVVGILMRGDTEDLDDNIAASDAVAVYFPMSYQVGGYTLFIPRSWIRPVDLSVESAMRQALTGWIHEGAGQNP